MCDLWYQLEKKYEKDNVKKFGFVIHLKIKNKEDIKNLYDDLVSYYKDFKYNEIVIQMRSGGDEKGEK